MVYVYKYMCFKVLITFYVIIAAIVYLLVNVEIYVYYLKYTRISA